MGDTVHILYRVGSEEVLRRLHCTIKLPHAHTNLSVCSGLLYSVATSSAVPTLAVPTLSG